MISREDWEKEAKLFWGKGGTTGEALVGGRAVLMCTFGTGKRKQKKCKHITLVLHYQRERKREKKMRFLMYGFILKIKNYESLF